ncbi:hypothetical protein KFK09_011294 [Dendrobium nobile]|uniref:HTH La-type RNA-binding domain-containing protein n=1 Tax=Dendrobium nobile TaxID=94219 RepID=A0A8T3BFI8_DENNO|nr:hypothetical protein KFK09_011294 [Dendrobium nobile]
MEQEAKENALDAPEDRITSSAPSTSGERSPAELSAESYLSRSVSSSRLNAGAPEFVPRVPTTTVVGGHNGGHQRLVKIHHHTTATPPMIPVLHPRAAAVASPQFVTPGPPIGVYDYYGGSVGGGAGGFAEHEFVQAPADSDPATSARDGLSDDIVQKVTKQVEYYFSDVNLATTEHLMRFISKDPEGFVPIAVIASFKKIKALVHNNMLLSNALRTSAKLVVSDDGKKVRRLHPFTEADVDELQSRIVVAENLPEDHCYQNLMKIFSAVGSVKTIRTCYPQTPNGTTNPTNRSSKLDMLFSNKLSDLSDERNWRSGLKLRLLNKCMAKQVAARGRKAGHEGDGTGEEEDVLATNQPNERQPEYPSQPPEASCELLGDDGLNEKENGGGRRGRGQDRGRGRARGQYINNNNNQRGGGGGGGGGGHGHGHAIGTPPSNDLMHSEQPAASRQPPGPRMPDGTRGFAMGRGRPITASSTVTTGV